MKLRVFHIPIIIIIYLAFQFLTDTVFPVELRGVWKTSAPEYKNSTMEFTYRNIIFATKPDHIDENLVKTIVITHERNQLLYTIDYENKEGEVLTLSFYYFQDFDESIAPVIRYKNQLTIEWRKKPEVSPDNKNRS